MATERDSSLDGQTFSQRYGYESLPEPMRLEQISSDLRRRTWNTTRSFLLENRTLVYNQFCFNERVSRIAERVLGDFFRKPEDEINTEYKHALNAFREVIISSDFNRVLDFVEIMVNDHGVSSGYADKVRCLFEHYGAAYRLDMSQRPRRFFPHGSKEQADETQRAIETLRESSMEGAATHLREAAAHINARQFSDSIVDSIHAVESVARAIDSKASRTLGPALNSLEKLGLLKHRALKDAFVKLYGYTSDEEGIRHALVEKARPDVGLDEAIFMYGACASFAAYLTGKHRQAEQQQPNP